jgi:hypothetical protein
MPILLERLGQEQERLGQVIEGAAQICRRWKSPSASRPLDHTGRAHKRSTTTLASRINALNRRCRKALILDKRDRTEAFAVSVGGAVGFDRS